MLLAQLSAVKNKISEVRDVEEVGAALYKASADDNSLSHIIFDYFPLCRTRRYNYGVKPRSHYTLDLLIRHLADLKKGNSWEFYEMVGRSDQARVLFGQMFEREVHNLLSRPEQSFQLELTSLQDGHKKPLHLNDVKQVSFSEYTLQKCFAEANAADCLYLQPAGGNFPSVDSLLYQNKRITLFQCTVADKHTIRTKGLNMIQESLPLRQFPPKASKDNQWDLVFVAPLPNGAVEPKLCRPQLIDGAKSKDWADNIHQYVLAIDSNWFWHDPSAPT